MKNIIITGANGNLGTVVTKKFLDSGYRVLATVIHEDAVKDLASHPNLHVNIVNLTNESETASFVQKSVSKYKQIDAALMLVGGFAAGDIHETGAAELTKQYSLNFETAYFIARPLFQHMIEKGHGRLVFIGARPALHASDGKNLLAYALGKSLLFKLAEFLNEEARGKNVTATVVVPSTLDTAANRKYMPLTNPQDLVRPEQLAEVLDFIVSEKSSGLREPVLKVYNNV
ncbi:MAG TPA: SDR family NAD(P)-dependent oxidoreductase [Puia sp.]|nr:SDR family NAD(P)-dependent oxidoreductase [Puia sp.]